MTAAPWYVARNKHKVGPFTAAELKQLATFGLLGRDEMVWAEGQARWVAAGSLAWLFPRPGQKRYWLRVAGQTRGPYPADQIRAALVAGQVGADTLACLEGDQRWAPLAESGEMRASGLGACTPSQARLHAGGMGAEEAELYLAGKGGDGLAELLATLLDLRKACASNTTLAESLDRSIEVVRARRAEGEIAAAGAPPG